MVEACDYCLSVCLCGNNSSSPGISQSFPMFTPEPYILLVLFLLQVPVLSPLVPELQISCHIQKTLYFLYFRCFCDTNGHSVQFSFHQFSLAHFISENKSNYIQFHLIGFK